MTSAKRPAQELDPFDQDQQFQDLIDAMKRIRPLALLGAGASIGSGYPSWAQLLQRLGDKLMKDGSKAVAPKLIGVVQDLQDPAWQAEEFYNALTANPFNDFLKEAFASRPTAEPHHLIASLGFRHVLTTNFESCAEDAFQRAYGLPAKRVIWSRPDQVQEFFTDLVDAEATPSVVYLHGHVDDPESIVLKESDYSRMYLREDNRRRLIALFMMQPVVFIGFSMNDPDLSQIMREVLFSLPGRPEKGDAADVARRAMARHFAIFGYRTASERDLIRRRMEGKFGLKTVFYRIVATPDGRSYQHDNMFTLLEALGAAAPPPPPLWVGKAPAKTRTAAKVSSSIERILSKAAGLVAPADSDRLFPSRGSNTLDELFDLDPNKGAFGGVAAAHGLELRAAKIKARKPWVNFELEVVAGPDASLKGNVVFHLHPTFSEPVETVRARNRSAKLEVSAVGAFTVGAVTNGTRLELDLSEDDQFPKWFREE